MTQTTILTPRIERVVSTVPASQSSLTASQIRAIKLVEVFIERAEVKMMFIPVFAAIVISVTGSALAQELRPLDDLIEDAAPGYAPTRCAGLYQAVMEWAGAERLGEEMWNQTDTSREGMMLLAARINHSLSGGTLLEQTELVVRDVRNIADIYLGRFESNYAREGQGFGGDTVVMSDLSFCGELAGSIRE